MLVNVVLFYEQVTELNLLKKWRVCIDDILPTGQAPSARLCGKTSCNMTGFTFSHLLTLKLFQTSMGLFVLLNTKEDIWKNVLKWGLTGISLF